MCRSNVFFISRQNMHAQKIRYAICQGLSNKLIYKDKGIESLKDKCNIYVSLIYWGDNKLSTVIPPISRQPEQQTPPNNGQKVKVQNELL